MISLLTHQMFRDAVEAGKAYAQSLIDTGQTGGRTNLVILAGVRNMLLETVSADLVHDAARLSLGETPNGTVIHQDSVDSGKEWKYPYGKIAEGKFEVSARTGLSTHDLHLPANRDLIMPGDILWPGSVTRRGIVIAASGFQSSFDRAVCEAILANIEAALNEAYLMQVDADDNKIEFFVPQSA